MVLAAIVSVQFGAAIAKGLFGRLPPTTIVWMRLATAAMVLMAWARPRFRGRTRRDWLLVLAFGVALAGMNWSFYQAFARIPLGIAVSIEFLGPLGVALAGSRRPLDVAWVFLAGLGVYLLGWSPTKMDPVGFAFGGVAAIGWASYILLSARVGRSWPGVSGLAIASSVGALGLLVPAIVVGGSGLRNVNLLLLGGCVGILSSVIPYSLEMHALRHIPTAIFGILMSLEPAVAAAAAWLLLRERLSLGECLAMACVVVASIGVTRSGARSATDEPTAVVD